jgi:hypothetical protein
LHQKQLKKKTQHEEQTMRDVTNLALEVDGVVQFLQAKSAKPLQSELTLREEEQQNSSDAH